MRITIVYRYFWPDTAPYSLLLAKMVPWFSDAGHAVRIIAGQPAYGGGNQESLPKREVKFGADVYRLSLFPNWLKVPQSLNMLLFALLAALRILFGPKQDLVWFGTTPPVVQGFLVSIAARLRGIPTLYQMQDIHPEIAITSNNMKASFVSRMLNCLERYTLRTVKVVTVLSQDMADCIAEKSEGKANVRVINNFAIETDAAGKKPDTGPVRFCYAGNIGKFQNLEALISRFADIDPEDAILNMVGDGKLKSQLEEYCTANRIDSVKFLGWKQPEETLEHLMSCHVGVVSLVPGIYRFAYPTKLHTYRAAGLKILAMVEKESKLAELIEKRNIGSVVEWSSTDEEVLASIRDVIAQVRSGFGKVTSNNEEYQEWHPNVAKEKWLLLLSELEAGSLQ